MSEKDFEDATCLEQYLKWELTTNGHKYGPWTVGMSYAAFKQRAQAFWASKRVDFGLPQKMDKLWAHELFNELVAQAMAKLQDELRAGRGLFK